MDSRSHKKSLTKKCIMDRFHLPSKTHVLLTFMVVRMVGHLEILISTYVIVYDDQFSCYCIPLLSNSCVELFLVDPRLGKREKIL